MERYILTGLCCGACAGRVEEAVNALEGVERCTVNGADSTMEVEGTALPEEVIAAVEAAGYGAAPEEAEEMTEEAQEETLAFPEEAEPEAEMPAPRSRRADWILLGVSAVLLAGLIYLALGYLVGLPAPVADPVTAGLVQAALAIAVLAVSWKSFRKAFDFRHGAPNGETLAVLGALGAFLYSAFALYMVSRYQSLGQTEAVAALSHSFCFEAVGIVVLTGLCGLLTEKYTAAPTGKDAGLCLDLILLAVLTVAGWLEAGQSLGTAVARGVSVLAISCPAGVLLAAGTEENGRKKKVYGLVWMAVYHVIALLLASGVLGIWLHPLLCAVIMCLGVIPVLVMNRKAPAAEESPEEEEAPEEGSPAEEAPSEEEEISGEETPAEEEISEEAAPDEAEEAAEEEPAEKAAPAGEEILQKTIHIEGLKCAHCEERTRKTLEMLGQVIRAEVSHTDGTAVVTMNGDISDRILIAAVEAEGYKVTSIE